MEKLILDKENRHLCTPDGRILISYIGHDVFQINCWDHWTGALTGSRCLTREVLLRQDSEITMCYLIHFGSVTCTEIEDLCEVCA